MKLKDKIYNFFTHLAGEKTKRYYFEDYIRVYPDGIVFNRFGRKRKTTKDDIINFLNHTKSYRFAAQFVKGKCVADVGCGSGYGCEILKKSGAARVCGSDISEHSINFAKSKYSDFAEFTAQGMTDMKGYPDDSFDIAASTEVIEHVQEYGMEGKALIELKRITRNKGLIIVSTPNKEMLDEHGFSFEEIDSLFKKNFQKYCIFENALIPFGEKKALWYKRLSEAKTGIIVSEDINLSETVLPKGVNPEIKKGIEPGYFQFEDYSINTKLLHNTHSWIVIAVNDK